MNHGKMCTSKDITGEDSWTTLRINTKWLFQPFYNNKVVIKNTTSTKIQDSLKG